MSIEASFLHGVLSHFKLFEPAASNENIMSKIVSYINLLVLQSDHFFFRINEASPYLCPILHICIIYICITVPILKKFKKKTFLTYFISVFDIKFGINRFFNYVKVQNLIQLKIFGVKYLRSSTGSSEDLWASTKCGNTISYDRYKFIYSVKILKSAEQLRIT